MVIRLQCNLAMEVFVQTIPILNQVVHTCHQHIFIKRFGHVVIGTSFDSLELYFG
ncbi:hypothetical protein D3C86_1171320 [compost metagenome]